MSTSLHDIYCNKTCTFVGNSCLVNRLGLKVHWSLLNELLTILSKIKLRDSPFRVYYYKYDYED